MRDGACPRAGAAGSGVLGVNATHSFSSWIGEPGVSGTAGEIARRLDAAAWQRLSAGTGTEGERLEAGPGDCYGSRIN